MARATRVSADCWEGATLVEAEGRPNPAWLGSQQGRAHDPLVTAQRGIKHQMAGAITRMGWARMQHEQSGSFLPMLLPRKSAPPGLIAAVACACGARRVACQLWRWDGMDMVVVEGMKAKEAMRCTRHENEARFSHRVPLR